MIQRFTQLEFDLAKSKDLLNMECERCGNTFQASKHKIVTSLNPNRKEQSKYCSKSCQFVKSTTSMKVDCKQCNKTFEKQLAEIKKSSNNFCSQSCAAIYNNAHKSHGTRRSKLETYIESQLSTLYPQLIIEYNKKSAISSELDIYIPSLNLAFELNGIFHYEPIYGIDKLSKIQNNDMSKSKACHNAKIDLCIIDTSKHTYVKSTTNKKYLDIVTSIINSRLPYCSGDSNTNVTN